MKDLSCAELSEPSEWNIEETIFNISTLDLSLGPQNFRSHEECNNDKMIIFREMSSTNDNSGKLKVEEVPSSILRTYEDQKGIPRDEPSVNCNIWTIENV